MQPSGGAPAVAPLAVWQALAVEEWDAAAAAALTEALRAAGEDAGAHSLLLRCCSECRSVCELARASEPDGWRERASEEARPVLG